MAPLDQGDPDPYIVQDNTIQALYWYNLLMVNYTAHNPCIVRGGEKTQDMAAVMTNTVTY